MVSNGKTVVVGLSGGVDSSVAALLLKKQGYVVIGLHMKGENPDTAPSDEKRVREICDGLGIELKVVDFSDGMQGVKDYFIQEYKAGRTPNPCVICNRDVKFSPFLKIAEDLGADFYATGHYARVEHKDGKHTLKRAVDENKDQSYFLCQLSNKQISKVLFPVGELTKDQVRKIAEENNLVSAETKDSYDICFLGSEKFKNFMTKNYPEKQGNIVDERTGKIVGKHVGISKYTVGQRKGLGIGGTQGQLQEPWFVSKKDAAKNIIYVSQGSDEKLFSSGLISEGFNFINEPEERVFDCSAKFRYRQQLSKVKVEVINSHSVKVTFIEKQKAITPGQFVVLYRGDTCLGGGAIDEVLD